MAECDVNKRNVLLCVDNSKQADWAFECKCFVLFSVFQTSIVLVVSYNHCFLC